MISWNLSKIIALHNIPKVQMAAALGLIFLSALIYNHFSINILISGALAVLGCLGFDFLFWKLKKIPPFLPSAALVTGLIIALLSSPQLPWYAILASAFLAMTAKNFFRVGGRHLFNPAALGLFLGGLIFQQNISWWGVSFQQLQPDLKSVVYFLILVSPLFVSILKMKRFRIILPFLITYGLIFLFTKRAFDTENIRSSFLDPTVLFFALVILPEPKTSPNNFNKQIVFGILVAVLVFFFSQSFLSAVNFLLIPDPLIFALLIANLISFKFLTS